MHTDYYEDGPHAYYDEDTGRNLVIVPVDEYQVRKISDIEEQRAHYRRLEAMKSGGNTGYVNCYHDPIKALSERLELHELGALLKLLPYMSREHGGELITRGKRMGIDDIAKVIGKSKRPTIRIVTSLTDSGVLIAEKDGKRHVYRVNPEYHSIGAVIGNNRFTKLYQTKTRLNIEKVSIQAAGLLYKTIPYFHFQRYYLCANPNESNPREICHLTQEDLAALIGEDPSTVSRRIQELIRAGFIMRMESYGNYVLIVNPDVMYRKKYRDEEAERISAQFALVEHSQNWRALPDISDDGLPS